MARRRKPKKGSSARSRDYEIGYGKPPKESQFKPGQSGNPAGRPKGLRNFKTDVIRMLEMPVRVKDGNRTRRTSTQEACLMVVREQSLRGGARALSDTLELAKTYNPEINETGLGEALSADDEAILHAFKAELLAEAGTPPSKATERRRRPAVRRRKVRDE
jgi:Family of unknown function (DUF5681)